MRSVRNDIIRKVQTYADTENQKIDASIVSRVVSITLDEVLSLFMTKEAKRKANRAKE